MQYTPLVKSVEPVKPVIPVSPVKPVAPVKPVKVITCGFGVAQSEAAYRALDRLRAERDGRKTLRRLRVFSAWKDAVEMGKCCACIVLYRLLESRFSVDGVFGAEEGAPPH